MRVFVTRWFSRFARSERISEGQLCDAIHRAQRSIVDADLGRGLVKQRVARPGQGRSGGFRVLIAYRRGARAVFLYGFAKSERDNIRPDQLAAWQARAHEVLSAGDDLIERNIAEDHLKEVHYEEEES